MAVKNAIQEMFAGKIERLKVKDRFVAALNKNSKAIVKLNTDQLDQGDDAVGNSLGVYKFYNYKMRFAPVDLKLTGSFRNRFFLDVKKDETEINSVDDKRNKLVDKYGKDIFGVQDKKKMAEVIKNDFLSFCKRELLR